MVQRDLQKKLRAYGFLFINLGVNFLLILAMKFFLNDSSYYQNLA